MYLLFDTEHTFLGTIFTRRGQLDHAQLTPAGEKLFGARVEHWRTRGIPRRTWIERAQESGSIERVCIADYCSVHDERFEQAIGPWAEEHQITAVKLQEDRLVFWEGLCSIPMDPTERFVLLLAMRQASKEDLPIWRDALAEAHESSQRDRMSNAQTMGLLKKRLHNNLLSPFAKNLRSP